MSEPSKPPTVLYLALAVFAATQVGWCFWTFATADPTLYQLKIIGNVAAGADVSVPVCRIVDKAKLERLLGPAQIAPSGEAWEFAQLNWGRDLTIYFDNPSQCRAYVTAEPVSAYP